MNEPQSLNAEMRQRYDHFFDLNAVARVLKRQPQYKKLAGLIEAANGASSCKTDLDHALKRLQLIAVVGDDLGSLARTPDEGIETIIHSLFVSALILYVRALHSSTRNRSKVPPVAYDEADQAMHKELVALRNDVVAHFGPGDTLRDGEWARDDLTLMISDKELYIHPSWQRANYKANLLMGLQRVLPKAIEHVDAVREKRQRELWQSLSERWDADDRVFFGILAKYRLSYPPELDDTTTIVPSADPW